MDQIKLTSSPTIIGNAYFVNGRVSITSGTSPIDAAAILHVDNDNAAGVGLYVRSRWTSPFINNDCVLFDVYNDTPSNGVNRSWAASCGNPYHNLPQGVTDSGTRVGVIGWATSVAGKPGYEHRGRIAEMTGVHGTSGFQDPGTPATARITEARGGAFQIYSDSAGATIDSARAVVAVTNGGAGTIVNNIAVAASAQNGTSANHSFYGFAGEMTNQDLVFGITRIAAKNRFSQADAAFTARAPGNSFEFGNNDPAGYGSNLGSTTSAGFPFLAFNAETDATGNTYRTRGHKGIVMWSNLGGDLIFSRVPNANASGQAPVETMRLTRDGHMIFADVPIHADNAAAVAAGLVPETLYRTPTGEARFVI